MMKKFFTKKLSVAFAIIVAFLFFKPQVDAQWIFEVTSPESIAGKYGMGIAAFGALPQDTTFGKLKIGRDNSDNPTLACESLVTDLTGFIGVVDRGNCAFVDKILNVQAANAIAAVICNNRDEVINLTGNGQGVTIQSLLLRKADCDKIKAVLSSEDVNVKIYRQNENVLWSHDFANLDGWSSSGANGDLWYIAQPINNTPVPTGWGSSPNSQYNYTLHPTLQRYPRFYGTAQRIQSKTVNNGFLMLDSDAWNNTANNSFTQNLPEASIVSPPIDLSAYENLNMALTFTNALRYCCSSSAEQFTVDVSTNDFNTYVRFDAGEGLAVNASSVDNTPVFNLSSALIPGSDYTNVRIRFNYSNASSHYYWMIDDVAIIELPKVNVQINESFNPVFTFATPKEFIYADTFAFQLDLRNRGENQARIVSKVRVYNAATFETYYEEAVEFENIGTDVDSIVSFNGRFEPALPVGDYIISYSTEVPGEIDYNYADNFNSFAFRVVENIYAKDDPRNTTFTSSIIREADNRWAWGNVYYIAPVENPNVVTSFTGSQHAFISNQQGGFDPNSGDVIIVYLMEFKKEGYLGNYFEEIAENRDVWTPEHPNLTQVAYAFVDNEKLAQIGSGNLYTIDLTEYFDPITNEAFDPVNNPLNLNPNKLYALLIAVINSSNPNVRIATTTAIDYSVPTGLLYTNNNNFTGFTGSSIPISRMLLNIREISSTNDVITEARPVKAFPIPASDQLFMNFGFEQPTDIEVQMIDVDGRLVTSKKHSQVLSEDIPLDVKEINTGNYILRVTSKDGIQTSKVLIIK